MGENNQSCPHIIICLLMTNLPHMFRKVLFENGTFSTDPKRLQMMLYNFQSAKFRFDHTFHGLIREFPKRLFQRTHSQCTRSSVWWCTAQPQPVQGFHQQLQPVATPPEQVEAAADSTGPRFLESVMDLSRGLPSWTTARITRRVLVHGSRRRSDGETSHATKMAHP